VEHAWDAVQAWLDARPWFELGLACASGAALGCVDAVRATAVHTLAAALAAFASWAFARSSWRGRQWPSSGAPVREPNAAQRASEPCAPQRASGSSAEAIGTGSVQVRALCTAALVALALLRAAQHALPRPGELPPSDAVSVGRWRGDRTLGRGWIDSGDGAPSVRLTCEFAGLEEGEWIALLPGNALRRYAASTELPAYGATTQWAGTAEPHPDQLVRLAPARATAAARLPVQGDGGPWRRELVARAQRLERELPVGFARALLFGESRALDPEVRDLFARTGTLHLLAVSGTHLVLLCALLLDPLGWLLRRLPWVRRCGTASTPRMTRTADTTSTLLAPSATNTSNAANTPNTAGPAHATNSANTESASSSSSSSSASLSSLSSRSSLAARGYALALGLARAALLVAYVPLANGQAPVSRSALALGLAGLASLCPLGPRAPCELRAAQRRPETWTLWGLALALECAFDPHAPLRLSVQLTYAATLGLMVGYAAWRALLLSACEPLLQRARASSTGRERPWWIASVAMLAARGSAGALAASLAAVLATLPSTWAVLGECTPPGLLATPLCLPLFGVLLVALWCAVLLPGCVPSVAYTEPCRALLALLERIDTWPGTPLALPPRPLLLVVLGVVLAFVVARRVARDRHAAGIRVQVGLLAVLWIWLCVPRGSADDALVPREDALGIAACALAFGDTTSALRDAARADGDATRASNSAVLAAGNAARARRGDALAPVVDVQALDVGHGTCVVVRVGTHGAVVFDAGARERPGLIDAALEPLLARLGELPLWVALSHADLDHASAMPWLAGHRAPELWLGELPDAARRALPPSTRHLDVHQGILRLDWGAAVDAELWLLRGQPGPGNEGSRSLALRSCGAWIVLCGDAEEDGLRALLELPLPTDVRMLLWPHHGSDTPLLGALLQRLRPREVWISNASAAPIAAELTRRGQPWRSTAREGPLHLRLGSVDVVRSPPP
jgi:predicted membrane metal-binding protein